MPRTHDQKWMSDGCGPQSREGRNHDHHRQRVGIVQQAGGEIDGPATELNRRPDDHDQPRKAERERRQAASQI